MVCIALRVLYVGMYWDYGDPSRGTSYEENSFHAGLRAHPEVDVVHFDYVDMFNQFGPAKMNRELVKTASDGGFDCIFLVAFHDEVSRAALKMVSESGVTTIGWGCDDHWRYDDFSGEYAKHFDWWVTTSRKAFERFEKQGVNVIKSQWAVEPSVYACHEVPRDIDVSFVGQPHGNRRELIRYLRAKAGIVVERFGRGWGPDTRIDHLDMCGVFCRSKISLNLSNSSTGNQEQIKGRVFEVPGCRGFLLTDKADDLESYYTDGEEMVIFHDPDDLIDKIRYYLEHEDEREAITRAGYERTLREHTWKHRFDDIFAKAGLVT